jgi:hypothetical protein
MKRGIEEERNGGSCMFMRHLDNMLCRLYHQSRSATESQNFWALSAMFRAARASHLALCASASR